MVYCKNYIPMESLNLRGTMAPIYAAFVHADVKLSKLFPIGQLTESWVSLATFKFNELTNNYIWKVFNLTKWFVVVLSILDIIIIWKFDKSQEILMRNIWQGKIMANHEGNSYWWGKIWWISYSQCIWHIHFLCICEHWWIFSPTKTFPCTYGS